MAILGVLPLSKEEWGTIKRFYGGRDEKHDQFCALKTLNAVCRTHCVGWMNCGTSLRNGQH